ncbi:acyl-CoA thioesterase [Ruegeria sp. MALMAid1280]|uniref:acyl-CoA thioesterase n=1 Tax=Ruegeria sp. MALMAid1280 TaxID=3411634 RepID=UPI003BA143A7
MISSSIETRVQFYDLDPMEIMWHGNYVKLFEEARCALLDKLEYNFPQMREDGFGWPVVDLRVKYVAPARFGMRIRVTATLREYLNRMVIDYQVVDIETDARLTKGQTTMVCVAADTGVMQFETPATFRAKVENQSDRAA